MPTRDQITRFTDSEPDGANPWVTAPSPRVIKVVDYDPSWPKQAQLLIESIGRALGPCAIRIDHIGSTSVPGLAAKPVIDIDLIVADPSAESTYRPPLEEEGFVLTIREPWWFEHRMFDYQNCDEPSVVLAHLHVFDADSPEPLKHLVFRNWLRASAADRDLYATVKRAAAAASRKNGETPMEYNARKDAVIQDIYSRAFRAAGFLN